MALQESLLKQAINELYIAALDPEHWSTALKALGDSLGGFAGSLIPLKPGKHNWIRTATELESIGREYVSGGWDEINYRVKLGVPHIQSGHRFATERMLLRKSELDLLPIQQDFFRRHGMRSFLAFDFAPGLIGACVERGDKQVEDWELAMLDQVHPHLQQIGALAISRADGIATTSLDVLELIERPAILLNRRGHLVACNHATDKIFSNVFALSERRLMPFDTAARATFERMLAKVLQAQDLHDANELSSILIRARDGTRILVRVMPFLQKDPFSEAKAILLLNLLDRKRDVQEDLLRSIFNLTAAEARLSGILVNGVEIAAAAKELNVAPSTLRTHLNAIFSKTGTRRQPELVALLSRVLR